MKKEKLLALVLALTMLLALCAGCGTGSSEEPQAPDTPSENVSQGEEEDGTASPEEPTADDTGSGISYPISDGSLEITLAMGIPEFILGAVEGQRVENIAAYKAAAEACGIELLISSFGMEVASEQVNLLASGGDMPDIINSLTEFYSSGAVGAIDDGVCIDLLQYRKYAPDYFAYYDANEDYRRDVTDDEGRVASMYGAQEENYNISGLMLRGDYLTALGLEVPTTYDQLESVLLAMTSEYDIMYPAFFTGEVQLGSLIHGYGVDTNTYSVNADGKVVYNVVTDEFHDYLTMLNRWYENGLINMDMLINGNITTGDKIPYMADGRAVLVAGESDFMNASNRALSEDEGYDLIPLSDPTLTEGGTLRVGGDNGRTSITVGWSVTTDCENVPEVAMFMNWFWTEEGQLVSNFGIENEAFVYDENGNPVYTDLVLNNPDVGFAAAWRGNTSFQVPSLAWYSSVEQTFTDESQRACAEVWSKNRSIDGTYFGSLNTEESDVVRRYEPDLETLADERIFLFVTGSLNLDSDWDAFVADMETRELAQCVEIYQQAYERYLAK